MSNPAIVTSDEHGAWLSSTRSEAGSRPASRSRSGGRVSDLAGVQAASSTPRAHIRIARSRHWATLNIHEFWEYRELFAFLVWRDVKTRYTQTALGPLWAIVGPITSMIVFSVIFGHLVGIKPEYGVPYPLFVFTALLPWTYFSSSLSASSTSVVGNLNLVTKVYVPRLMLPIEAVIVPLFDFLVSFLVLIGMFVYFGRAPHWHAIFIPFFLGMAMLTALGVGLWMSALNVRFRDVRYVVPFLTQIWMYASPVIYGVSIFPKSLQWLIALNPMVGVIDGFRWTILGRGLPNYGVFATSYAIAIVLVLGGLAYFKHVERGFADLA